MNAKKVLSDTNKKLYLPVLQQVTRLLYKQKMQNKKSPITMMGLFFRIILVAVLEH